MVKNLRKGGQNNMATHVPKNLRTARIMAQNFRKKGFNAQIFKTKTGLKVSVTRK